MEKRKKKLTETSPKTIIIIIKWKLLSRVQLFATPWTIQSKEFSRPEHWNGELLSPGDLPNLGIKPWSPALQADSLPAEPQGSPIEFKEVIKYSNSLSSPRNTCNLKQNIIFAYQMSLSNFPIKVSTFFIALSLSFCFLNACVQCWYSERHTLNPLFKTVSICSMFVGKQLRTLLGWFYKSWHYRRSLT